MFDDNSRYMMALLCTHKKACTATRCHVPGANALGSPHLGLKVLARFPRPWIVSTGMFRRQHLNALIAF